jgi:hypothetical protein
VEAIRRGERWGLSTPQRPLALMRAVPPEGASREPSSQTTFPVAFDADAAAASMHQRSPVKASRAPAESYSGFGEGGKLEG